MLVLMLVLVLMLMLVLVLVLMLMLMLMLIEPKLFPVKVKTFLLCESACCYLG